jgi:hypothetical protein
MEAKSRVFKNRGQDAEPAFQEISSEIFAKLLESGLDNTTLA